MSVNRELVVFYITYKLSQRNFPLDHIGLLEADQSSAHSSEAAAASSDSHLNGVVNGSPAPSTDANADTNTDANMDVSSEANSPLSQSTPTAPPRSPPAASAPPPDLSAVKEALRDSANEFELRFARAFSDLHRQLHITPATAYRSFESVMDEVFRDGVNWGRVVGLFAFGGALAVECVEKEMSPLVARLADWMTVYLDNHIQDWITGQGGWARFAEIYGQDAAAESRRSQESLKKWLWAGMTLVTGVVVGSIIAQKRL